MSPLASSRIKALRERVAWSQRELARRAGIRQATLSTIESGKSTRVTVDVLEKIADALGVDAGALLNRR